MAAHVWNFPGPEASHAPPLTPRAPWLRSLDSMDSLFPGRRTTVAVHSERPRLAGKPCLIVISGPGLGERRELGEDDTEIGRSESCTLCINSDQVSRRHANVLRIA